LGKAGGGDRLPDPFHPLVWNMEFDTDLGELGVEDHACLVNNDLAALT
jgi:hypothetical protein